MQTAVRQISELAERIRTTEEEWDARLDILSKIKALVEENALGSSSEFTQLMKYVLPPPPPLLSPFLTLFFLSPPQ
jgi:hypothetical protein